MDEADRISNLPTDLAQKILSHLPIRDAVRTSVLSSDWRYKSAMLSHLVFDDECIPTEHYTFASIVDHVLSSHIGSIHLFELSQENLSFRDIDRWILHLSRNSVKVFILINSSEDCQPYVMPSCMFACQDLTGLYLYKCLLQPPSAFEGFRSLVNLRLEHVTLAQNVLESLTCSSLLERLELVQCVGFQQLKIDAPNLRYLLFFGEVDQDIDILNTLKLVEVRIALPVRRNRPRRSTNLLKFFARLPHVRQLVIYNYLTKFLAIGSSLEKLPNPCLHLEYLSLSVCYNDPDDILIAFCLLKSCPALKILDIHSSDTYHYQLADDAGKVNSRVNENQRCAFTQLRHVDIFKFPAVEPAAIEVVKFLVLSSPALETMTIRQSKPVPTHVGFDLARTLPWFRRASVNLEIILL